MGLGIAKSMDDDNTAAATACRIVLAVSPCSFADSGVAAMTWLFAAGAYALLIGVVLTLFAINPPDDEQF
jgi:hypothetical protein